MIDLIDYKDTKYPYFQSQGNAAQFTIPFAKQLCKGHGYDIGCKKVEWAFPGAVPVDPLIDPDLDAFNLPDEEVDYIFSSHCLEHLYDWVEALNYWWTKIKKGGIIYLYLPDFSQKYWRPWNNRQHFHVLTPEVLHAYFNDKGAVTILKSGVDLNSSFTIVAEK